MATLSKSALLANTFGTFGYISCLLQWLFVALLYLPLLLDNKQFKNFLLPENTEQVTPVVTTAPSPILIGLAIIFTVIMLIVTMVLIIRAPISIARTGKAVTVKAADAIVPLVVHRPVPAAKKRSLTRRLIKAIKLGMIVIPFLLILASVFIATPLPQDVIIFVGAALAIGSLLWFSAQYLSARWLNVRIDNLV
jgi:hypothetical protein